MRDRLTPGPWAHVPAHLPTLGVCPLSPHCLPALLQSTVKEFFWPTKAWDSPGPRVTTLLASEENLGMEL